MLNAYIKHPLLMFVATVIVMYFVALPTVGDALRAYKNTDSGDRYRLFLYYTTARYQSVPIALDKFGVKPNQ